MLLKDWKDIKYFKSFEFNRQEKMDKKLIVGLDKLREYIDKPIIINCSYEDRKTGGYHPEGKAVDIHVKGMHFFDLFIAASRFDEFNGIGIYPYWNNPGIHLDTRPKIRKYETDALWIGIAPRKYIPFTSDNIRKII